MQKIPTIFERDETLPGHPVKPVVKPECAWVLAGEGNATQKMDGTNVRIIDGRLEKRQKPKERDYDDASYVPCRRDDTADRWLFEAFDALENKRDGIYEAIGPKIQGNPEGVDRHVLVQVVPPLVILLVSDAPRTFDGFREFFLSRNMEGLVFHHEDGRMAKIKARDFGLTSGKARDRYVTDFERSGP